MGYLIRGQMRVGFIDREEVINAEDTHYLAPGYMPFLMPGTELVEFSPKEPYQATLEVAIRNYVALAQA